MVVGSALLLCGLANHCDNQWQKGIAEQEAKNKAQQEKDDKEAVEADKREAAEKTAQEQAEKEEAERKRSAAIARLSVLTPWQRLIRLKKCHRQWCDDDDTIDFILAAANDVERARLKHVDDVMNLQDELSSRAVLCSDGSESDSCTCGSLHRGCCSHHGGVARCVPLE